MEQEGQIYDDQQIEEQSYYEEDSQANIQVNQIDPRIQTDSEYEDYVEESHRGEGKDLSSL